MSWESIICCKCKVHFCVETHVKSVLLQSSQIFYCPYGHQQHFKSNDELNDEAKLRQERDRLRQQLAEKDDEIIAANRAVAREREKRDHEKRRVAAARGQVTRLKNRAAAGVCPCCNRTFQNLATHMQKQHPKFREEPQAADNVKLH